MSSLDQLFAKVKQVMEEALQEKRGRPKKWRRGRPLPDRRAVQTVIMLLLGTLKGWSLQKLQERLSAYHDPQWRRLCGLPLSEVPPYSTLAYRSHNAKVKRWQERLYQRMLRVLLNCRNLGLLAIDMTDLPRDLKDKLANWGVCGKGSFYGYKVHLIVTRDGVPLAVVVTRANKTEPTVTAQLLHQSRRRLTKEQVERLAYAVADAAYDTVKIYESFADLEAQLIAAVNPRNNAKLKGGCHERVAESWGSEMGRGPEGSCCITASEVERSIKSGLWWNKYSTN
jgi:hypothetical protein